MHKSNLIEILKIFTVKEFKDFGDFVKSPFFNKNENVINLYNYIKKYFPDLDSKELEKERVYKNLTGKDKYNDGYMRTVIFNLNKLAEDYLAYASQGEIEKQLNVLDKLLHRNADKLFEKKFRQIKDALDKVEIKDSAYFYLLYKLSVAKVAFNSNNRAFLNVKDFIDDEETDSLEYFMMYYFLISIPEYRFYMNQAYVVNLDAQLNFVDEIIAYLKRSRKYETVPLLNLHFNELCLVKEDEEKYFYALKAIAKDKEFDKYNYLIKYNCLGILVNFALRHYFKGKSEFLGERFELHNMILEKGLYSKHSGNYFDDMLFKNIATLGLQLNNVNWTEKFINDYIDKLDPATREDAYNLNYARLLLYKKNFAEALESLSKIRNVKHVHYKTEIKILTLIIYYEQNRNDAAITVIDNYRHFLSNDALLPEQRKERSYNFLKFTNELIKIKENPSSKAVYDLQFDIKNTPNTYEKEWLFEKTEELLKLT